MSDDNDPGELEKVQAAYESLKQKTADWKVKVKEITLKDREHIQEQKYELEALNKQLQNQKEIIHDKTQELATLTSKHDDLRKELVETLSDLQKVSQYKSRIAELEDQLLQSEATVETLRTNNKAERIKNTHALTETTQERDAEIASKTTEIAQLRDKISDCEKRNEQLRQDLDGTRFLSRSTPTSVKRVCHEGNIWLLLEHINTTTNSKEHRWFEEELILSANSNIVTTTTEEEVTNHDSDKLRSLTTETASLREELKKQNSDHDRQLTLKNQEVARLLKRIETLQEEHSKVVLRQNQKEGTKIIQLREELETQIRDELAGQLTDLQYKHEQTLSEVQKAKKDLTELNTEYTQYKLRAQTAISKSKSQQEEVFHGQIETLTQEKETLSKNLQQLQETHNRVSREFEEAVAGDRLKDKEMDEMKVAVLQLKTLCEESNREKNNMAQALTKLKKQHTNKKIKPPPDLQPETAAPPTATTAIDEDDDDVRQELKTANDTIADLKQKLEKTSSALKSVTEEMRARDDNALRFTPTPPPPILPTRHSSASFHLDDKEEPTPTNGLPTAESEEEIDINLSERQSLVRQRSSSSLVCTTSGGVDTVGLEDDFSVQDLVTAASLHDGSPVSQLRWTERKAAKLAEENHLLRNELSHHRSLPGEIATLKKQVEEANRSLQRQDCSRHIDYLKNIILQFCLAKNDLDMQTKMIPLLSSMLELSPDEKKNLDMQYPQS